MIPERSFSTQLLECAPPSTPPLTAMNTQNESGVQGPSPKVRTKCVCVCVRVRVRVCARARARGTSSLALEYFKWVYADRALSVMPTLTLLLSVTLYSAACRMSSQPKTERVCLYYRCGQQQGVGVRAEPDAAVCCHH